MTHELTSTEIKAKIRLFALPITLSMLVAQLYSVIDMAVIGRFLGADELAAVGNAANVVMVFLAISGGLEMAVEIIISQLVGRKDEKLLAQTARTVLAFDALCGVIVAVIGIAVLPAVFRMISVPESLMHCALLYGRIYLAGLFLIHVYDGGRAILTAAEDTKKSFFLMLTTTVLNLGFNLILIVVCHLGVAGSALGTVLAQFVGAVLTLGLLDRKFHFMKCSGRILDAGRIVSVLHIALPTTFQQFVVTFGGVLIQSFVNPFGREVIIGYVAILRIMNFFRIGLVGLAQTLTVYGAQLIAAGQYTGFRKVYRECSIIGLWYCAIQAVVFVLFPKYIASIFFDVTRHPKALAFFSAYLLAFLFIQLASVFKFQNEGLLRATVQMKKYLYCNVGELFLRIILTFVLIRLALFSTNVFWTGELAARVAMLLLSAYYLKRTLDSWKKSEKDVDRKLEMD